MKLYSYYRSSASYRVRIALALKGLNTDILPVNLLKAEQTQAAYTKLNPQGLVPLLIDGGESFTQSLAIIEYLEERYPQPPLLPVTPPERAHVRALSLAIACEMAPLNNSGVLSFLSREMGLTEEQKNHWYRHWIAKGFTALERMLAESAYTGNYCHDSQPTMADCCLVPQMYNARRFNCDVSAYPTLTRIADYAAAHPAFKAAHPDQQADNV